MLLTGFDARWCRLACKVEKVDICAHETLRQQLNADALFVLFLLELESTVIILWLIHGSTCVHGLLFGFLPGGAVLLEDLRLGGRNQLIFLFSLGLFGNLADAGVRVYNRLMFHI